MTPFDISLNYINSLTPSQEKAVENAEMIWESLIKGYQLGINISSLNIDIVSESIDGPNGTLGSGGPTSGISRNGFLLPTDGMITIDEADISNLENQGIFQSFILHEMAHAIGFGVLWNGPELDFPNTQELYLQGSGQFKGINAINAYQQEFNDSKNPNNIVPVEESGGFGIASFHWDEMINGSSDTGITNSKGQDLRYELMTAWLNPEFFFISNTTVQSFADIGYVTVGNNNSSITLGDEKRNKINGTSGDDVILGLDNRDRLNGKGGNDTINGGNDRDIIAGRQGNDVLTGGAGKDAFLFYNKNEGVDTIEDYSVTDDTIGVKANRFGLSKGIIAKNQFTIGSNATTSDHRFIYNATTGDLFFDENGSGNSGKFQLATLSAGLVMTNRDIVAF